MKVLLLFPMADGQTGPAIKYAFEKLGHKVEAVDAKLNPRKSHFTAIHFEPDLIFCSRTKELADQVRLIKLVIDAKVCMWNVDTRTNIAEWKHLFPLIKLCDYHFIVDSKTIPEWRKINNNTFWVSQGLQNEVYKKPLTITDEDRKKYSCDVGWAGDIDSGGHIFRRSFIKAVKSMDIDFKVWGRKGKSKIYNEEHNKMVSLSKINLAMSGWPENEGYVSVRDYKILGAGGFLLELDRKRIHDIFPVGTMDHYYHSSESFMERIRFYLINPELRKSRADNGYCWVRANATYTHRIKEMLNIMKGDLKC